jgi:hypothetical protein
VLQQASLDDLAVFLAEITANRMTRGGYILQDIVNELGGRLGFAVRHGRYQGVAGLAGYDGLWQADGQRLVVEVKSSDAFSIDLDLLARYARELDKEAASEPTVTHVLVVVAREDKSAIVSQIRGSRHAWTMRVVSVASLLQLVRTAQRAIDEGTKQALRKVLHPIDGTHLDALVDLIRQIATDAERSAIASEHDSVEIGTGGEIAEAGQRHKSHVALRERFRRLIESEADANCAIISPSVWRRPNGSLVLVSISRRYDNSDFDYWFSLRESWVAALGDAGSELCLLFADASIAARLSGRTVSNWLPCLQIIRQSSGSFITLAVSVDEGRHFLGLPLLPGRVDLSPFCRPI